MRRYRICLLIGLMFAILLVGPPCGATTSVSNASVTPSSLLSGATASYEVGFSATSGLPVGATITVVYPAGFNLTGATKTEWVGSPVRLQGISGQTITYTVQSWGAVSAGGYLFKSDTQTDGIVNPSTPGTYTVQISTSNDPTPVSVPVSIIETYKKNAGLPWLLLLLGN